MLRRQNLPVGVVEAARDPWGRIVMLSKSAMQHIAEGHQELSGCEVPIAAAIENAASRRRGKKGGREILYARNLGPTAWLAIVVAYEGSEGWVITAYGDKKGPRDEDLI